MSTIRFLLALWLLAVSLSSYANCPDNFSVSPLMASTQDDIIATFCSTWETVSSHTINDNVIDVYFSASTDFPATDEHDVYENIGKLPPGIYTINIYYRIYSDDFMLMDRFTVHVNQFQSTDISVPTLGVSSLALLVLMMSVLFWIKMGR